MTLIFTSIGSNGDTTAVSALSCALTRAPGANTLVLVGVSVSDTVGTAVEPTGVVGAGLTFSLVTSSITGLPTTPGSELANISLWRAAGAAPDGSMVTATFANNNTGANIIVTEVSGVTTVGLNGASAVSGSALSKIDSSSAITLFLPSASSTANGWFAIECVNTGSDQAPGVNWTFLDRAAHNTPTVCLNSASTTLSGATYMAWTPTANAHRLSIAVEVVADNPSVSTGGWASAFGVRAPRVFQPRVRDDVWVELGHVVTLDAATDTSEG